MRQLVRRWGRRVIVVTLAAATVLVGAPAVTVSAAPRASSDVSGETESGRTPVLTVDSGALRGARADGTDGFLGVPYARPPVGSLRWQAPQQPARWQGVRDAVTFGGRCAALASTNGPRSEAEDCLYLNVWRPAGARSGRRLPVYVWIHGGGLANGSSNQYDGSFLTKQTGVVVVSVNYRLGVFGFLAHPDLTGEAGQSGNYGFLDQQAALGWVHRNIAAFGGDPRQVTLGGESAGGFSACTHLVAPGSQGLFARAVIQSSGCGSTTLAKAETIGRELADTMGCATGTGTAAGTAVGVASCLRGLDVGALLDGATAFTPGSVDFVSGVPALPEDPYAAVTAGRFAQVPILIGDNRDEARTATQEHIDATAERYQEVVRKGTEDPALADSILARYPWPADADRFTAAYLIAAILTDSGQIYGAGCFGRKLAAALARRTPTFGYEFAHWSGPGLSPEPAGYVWGAGHAADLAYLWPSFDNGTPIAPTFTPDERRLSASMVQYWGSFVRTGRPFAPGSASWPADPSRNGVLSLRAGGASKMISDAELAAEHHCDLWDPLMP